MSQIIKLSALAVGNVGITFLLQWYVINQLGTGMETDALFAGMTVPQLVLTIISGSLMHVLVPILACENENKLKHDAWEFVFLATGFFGLIAIALYLSSAWWVPLIVPGFSDEGKALTTQLTRIQLAGMVFSAINGIQWANYHARQQYFWADIAPLISGCFSFLLLIYFLPRFGIIAAAWINVVRMAFQTLLLTKNMGKPVWPNKNNPTIYIAWLRIKPLLLGATYYKTDMLVDRFLLSTASNGSLSLYYLAQQIYGAIQQICNKIIAVPLVPLMSNIYKTGSKEEFRRLYNKKLLHASIISSIFFLMLLGIGKFLLPIMSDYGKLSLENLNLLCLVIILMAGQLFIGNIGMIMTSVFYSIGDTKSPTSVGVIAYTFGVIIKVALFYKFGLLGLSFGVSIYFLISLTLMTNKIHEKKYI
jgi:putative peptidoglycan lipid II flippase